MQFEDFARECHTWWTRYLTAIQKLENAGRLDHRGGRILFPTLLIVTSCNGFYVTELLGASPSFQGLKLKRQQKKYSIERYFSQFSDLKSEHLFVLSGRCNFFRFLCLAWDADFEEVRRRFPQIELYQSRLNRAGATNGTLLSFPEDFVSFAIENSVLVNRYDNLYRCKNILAAYTFRSNASRAVVHELFQLTVSEKEVKGTHTPRHDLAERLLLSAQLQTAYLFPELRETTIGEFLRGHPDIVKRALKTEHFVYEPHLEWIEHDGTCTDEAINPDLLVKRADGLYDIYDLKTALLDERSVTTSGRKRRGFIHAIEDGLSQLANYQEYFQYPKNAALAKAKYGVEIRDPMLVLVVGSWENVNPAEVQQASRKHIGNLRIIDYDTLCHLFLGTEDPQASAPQASPT